MATRTLYKYRSLTDFEFVADIILNQRFYAAQFFDLNDPMEGLFSYSQEEKEEYIEEIVKRKKELRICSFSRVLDDMLMWAHYADGFRGICIEAKISSGVKANRIIYATNPVNCSNLSQQLPSHILAQAALMRKNPAWEYEVETRLFTKDEYISEGIEITAILLGLRVPDSLKQAILRLTESTSIEVWDTEVDSDHNKIIKADKLSESSSHTCQEGDAE